MECDEQIYIDDGLVKPFQCGTMCSLWQYNMCRYVAEILVQQFNLDIQE